jgi:hypothetical protein
MNRHILKNDTTCVLSERKYWEGAVFAQTRRCELLYNTGNCAGCGSSRSRGFALYHHVFDGSLLWVAEDTSGEWR